MKNRIFIKISVILFWVLAVVACKLTNQSELYGTYLADYDVAKEKLTLHKDGTFFQEVTLKSTSRVDTSEGTWTYDPKTGYVRFKENFMPVLNGFRQLNPDYNKKFSSASLPADKYFGNILVGVAEGVLYKKIE